MTDEPTTREIVRQVEALVEQVRDLIREVRSEYVRKDLYDTRHENLTRRVNQLEHEADEREKARVGFQRQVAAGALVGLLLMLTQIILTLARTPGVGT